MSDAAAYLRPQGLQAALSELTARRCRPLAGATDLFPSAGEGPLPGPLLDLGAIDELQSIERSPTGVRIGACASWSSLLAADLPPAFDGLKAAAREVGGRQIQ
ncbi:MAG: FAD binding domain-containing protein, partial [Paracoccaceae bacterium]